MPWPIQMVVKIRDGRWKKIPGSPGARKRTRHYTLSDGREVTFDNLPVGACWHTDMEPTYHATRTSRRSPRPKAWDGPPGTVFGPSLCIVIPGKSIFRPHHPATVPGGPGWTVQGEPPGGLVVTPSIRTSHYHGFVGSSTVGPGIVSDDIDGRRFARDGVRLLAPGEQE